MKIVRAAELTIDGMFDMCYEANNNMIGVLNGAAKSDCPLRKALAENAGKKVIELVCHDGRMKGKFRISPVGYAVNLTQKYGMRLKRPDAMWSVFKKWKENEGKNSPAKSPFNSSDFNIYLQREGFFRSDYIVVMEEYEFT